MLVSRNAPHLLKPHQTSNLDVSYLTFAAHWAYARTYVKPMSVRTRTTPIVGRLMIQISSVTSVSNIPRPVKLPQLRRRAASALL